MQNNEVIHWQNTDIYVSKEFKEFLDKNKTILSKIVKNSLDMNFTVELKNKPTLYIFYNLVKFKENTSNHENSKLVNLILHEWKEEIYLNSFNIEHLITEEEMKIFLTDLHNIK